MKQPGVNDLDFLGALLHGRRSRLAEGGRLDALCHLRTLSELGRTVYPDTEFQATADFQRRLTRDLVRELSDCLKHLDGAGAELLAWMLARFQVENIKMLVRGLVNHVPFEVLRQYIVSLPHNLELDMEVLGKAESLGDFIARLPMGMPRRWLRNAASVYREEPRTFFLEAALDCGYFQELLARTEPLPDEENELIRPLILQEVDTFHLMLALRGRFHYSLGPEKLLPLHVRGSGISTERFAAMNADPDPLTAAARAVGRALDVLPSAPASTTGSGELNLAVFEALAWKRFLRLANRAFRRSHMGLGAVVGYMGIRRVEVANLITISEAIRTGLTAEAMNARLIPRRELEPAYV
jgi:vacuolar-type H+-ATPase subunit C/Vma6